MTLFEECVAALGKAATILSQEETIKLFENMIKNFPLTKWGRIDWEKVVHKRVFSRDQIGKNINPTDEVFILWDEGSLPAIKTTVDNILKIINDVTAVSFDTWIYSPNSGYVIEFYHENEITIGWI